ncbi:hypothetical protein [Candidatus Stoquefichus massiliensis]|uniref:hypothetical protein n=1 Tax=Candidatus Stoquefichus massiliensis TaxID=1470350 RepID=UPI0004865433|nr:hypothetical protein [Candidatus Stoquefichus massiliensis]
MQSQKFVQELQIMRNLQDAGCNNEQIYCFMQYLENKDYKKQVHFLKCHRCILKEDMHEVQKKIDCLDYLLYSLKKEEQNHEL